MNTHYFTIGGRRYRADFRRTINGGCVYNFLVRVVDVELNYEVTEELEEIAKEELEYA